MTTAAPRTFALNIPRITGSELKLEIKCGVPMFVLGANGTGKSALLQHLYTHFSENALRILGHRQIWFETGTVELTPRQKSEQIANIRNRDTRVRSRWINYNASERPRITLANLLDARTEAALQIADAAYDDDLEKVKALAAKEPPVATLNRMLRLANLPVQLVRSSSGDLVAERSDGASYDLAEMSDGERNAVLIATEVLTAKPGTLLLIDEPELHLHRSIITPLLSSLFVQRSDCAFVVSTHEVGFPPDFPDSPVLLLRDCRFDGSNLSAWDIAEVPIGAVREEVMRDILGARRKILFVEGGESSLDKRVYSAAFPGVTVIPKRGWSEVERATLGVRDATDTHWVEAYGIVDGDNRSEEEIEHLKSKGVYALDVCTIESVYYHPTVQSVAVESLMKTVGEDPVLKLQSAHEAAFSAIRRNERHLIDHAVSRAVIRRYETNKPGHRKLLGTKRVSLFVDVDEERRRQARYLDAAMVKGDLEYVIRRYPIQETGALKAIATALGFRNTRQYEQAVLTLVMSESSLLDEVRDLFGGLSVRLLEDHAAGV